jgi:hypothetical protein
MSLLDTASLIVTPNAYKEGKLYSVVPSDGSGDLSVTRATTATRVNSAGLVELVPYNLLTYSERFDNAAWTKTATTVAANATTAPNGTITADRIVESAVTDAHRVFQNISFNTTDLITVSVYVKADGRTKFAIYPFTTSAGTKFDLATGTVISNDVGIVSSSIQDVGNGWYRCVTSRNAVVGSNSSYFYLLNDAGATSYLGDVTKGVYIWGAQLNEGTLKDYFATETRLNIPRLDYSLGSCPSILVEPQRTNLALWSEQFDNAAWTKTGSTISANSSTAPNGTTTADTFIPNAGQTAANVNRSISVVVSPYTFSFYAKSFGQTKISLVSNLTGTFRAIVFNLLDGSVVTATGWTSAIESVGDGWYRCSATADAASASSYAFQISNNSTGWTGDGTSGIYLWGAQLEVGAYPTSYIGPTTSASVTRNADVISKTGISSLINPSEGTFFVGAASLNDTSTKFIELSNGTDLNRIIIRYLSGNSVLFRVVGGGGTYQIILPENINNFNKMAISWKVSGLYAYLNGVEYSMPLIGGVGGGVPVALDRLTFSQYWGGDLFLSNTKVVGVWKTQLTSTECIALTTL